MQIAHARHHHVVPPEHADPIIRHEHRPRRLLPQDLVEVYGIRAYIGVPLHHDGEVIGSLCAVDTKPRRWDASLTRDLKRIAAELEARLEALRESKDQDDAAAIPHVALTLILSSIIREAEALEGPVTRAGELLRSETWRGAAKSNVEVKGDPARELADLIHSLEEPVGRLRQSALRAADAIELRRMKAGAESLDAFRREARAVGRTLGELAPIARLIEGLSSGAISAEAFAKNASALTEAEASAGDMLTSLRGVAEIGERLAGALAAKTRN